MGPKQTMLGEVANSSKAQRLPNHSTSSWPRVIEFHRKPLRFNSVWLCDNAVLETDGRVSAWILTHKEASNRFAGNVQTLAWPLWSEKHEITARMINDVRKSWIKPYVRLTIDELSFAIILAGRLTYHWR